MASFRREPSTGRFAAAHAFARQRYDLDAAPLDQRTFVEHPIVEAQPAANLEEARRGAHALRVDRDAGGHLRAGLLDVLERRTLAHLHQPLGAAEIEAVD